LERSNPGRYALAPEMGLRKHRERRSC
jgi:hypothetical protein